ncbi:hypothetical protein [uncultured Clostridium sp.]|uniref:hypothetical protein n=1 Tax=uncultured Clostridium sp. TaxID=59620 RepID=UPI002625FB19|nr:hypothetical protein [uncultured Clostridium sp.]
MEIKYFKQAILNKNLPNKVILTGDEAILSMYIEQIYKNFEVKVLNSITDYLSIKSSKFNINNKNIVYLIYNDEIFKTNKNLWDLTLNNVIFVYNELKKNDKFFKAFEAEIIYFNPLIQEQLLGLLMNRINIPEEDIKWIINKCNSNYFKCLNEVEKISIFDIIDHLSLFNYFKKNGIFCKNDNIGSYDFSNAVSDKNKILALELVNKISVNDILPQLSLVYNNLRNQLLVQNSIQTAQQLGMNEKLYNVLKRKKNYTIEQLCKCLCILSDYLNKIKLGQLEPIDAINLFILECL